MTTPAKTCCVCHQDVSNAKRVKDTHGHYYCAACHEKLLQRHAAASQPVAAAAGAVRSGPPSIVKAPPASRGTEDDLLPDIPLTTRPATPPVPRPTATPARNNGAASKANNGSAAIPEFCPNCGTKTLAGRRICFKCNRDVTQMEKLAEMRKQEQAGPTTEEKAATAIGFVLKIGLWVFCIAVGLFVMWGVWLQIKPIDTFEDYPTSREQVVRDFLKYIDEGSDKSLNKAFLLVSFRERTTNMTSEDTRYKSVFHKMREDFINKYGADWHAKMKLENAGSNDEYADDEVDYKLILGEDKYVIATQVQIAVDVASVNMIKASKVKPSYPENGKNHFGILDIEGYLVNAKRTMIERTGAHQRQKSEF